MGKHSEWRKTVKKLRRKRIRTAKAKERDLLLEVEQKKLENSPHYQEWLQEQSKIEQQREEEEKIQAAQKEERWKEAEIEAQKEWKILQRKISLAREERMKQNIKIKLEWEKEQQRLKKLQLAKEKEFEEKRILQEKRDKKLLDFLEQGGDTPDHLKTRMETNPGKESCPFFEKVSACRFFDSCSRNHVRPGISKTLLISNFFTDISLQIKENEHGSDSSLEFEKADTYKHYSEFFYDVVSELEKCGRIKNFVTCCNHEAHLRGNVYVQYKTEREALITYHKFNCRWYGGKQLNVEFCNINNWKRAICGLFFRNRCPKGNTCNFLHAFRNPKALYFNFESENNDSVRSSRRSKQDNEKEDWDHVVISERGHAMRWSESPERIPSYHRKESKDSSNDERSSRRSHHHHHYHEHKKDLEERWTGSKERSRKRRSRSRSSSRRKSSHRKRNNQRSKRKRSTSSSDNDDNDEKNVNY